MHGIDACLSKPITPKGFLKTIERLKSEHTGIAHIKIGGSSVDKVSEASLFKNINILLVEDNPVNQVVALSVLKNLGVSADAASNGQNALKLLSDDKNDKGYAAIIMDCQMPEMDGYETATKIKAGDAGEAAKRIPIIAMTANAMQGDKQKCLDAGMDDYMTKPIEKSAVLSKLKKWVNKSV